MGVDIYCSRNSKELKMNAGPPSPASSGSPPPPPQSVTASPTPPNVTSAATGAEAELKTQLESKGLTFQGGATAIENDKGIKFTVSDKKNNTFTVWITDTKEITNLSKTARELTQVSKLAQKIIGLVGQLQADSDLRQVGYTSSGESCVNYQLYSNNMLSSWGTQGKSPLSSGEFQVKLSEHQSDMHYLNEYIKLRASSNWDGHELTDQIDPPLKDEKGDDIQMTYQKLLNKVGDIADDWGIPNTKEKPFHEELVRAEGVLAKARHGVHGAKEAVTSLVANSQTKVPSNPASQKDAIRKLYGYEAERLSNIDLIDPESDSQEKATLGELKERWEGVKGGKPKGVDIALRIQANCQQALAPPATATLPGPPPAGPHNPDSPGGHI